MGATFGVPPGGSYSRRQRTPPPPRPPPAKGTAERLIPGAPKRRRGELPTGVRGSARSRGGGGGGGGLRGRSRTPCPAAKVSRRSGDRCGAGGNLPAPLPVPPSPNLPCGGEEPFPSPSPIPVHPSRRLRRDGARRGAGLGWEGASPRCAPLSQHHRNESALTSNQGFYGCGASRCSPH